MSVFECIKVMVAAAKAKMNKFDFTLWVLSALLLMASSAFLIALGVYSLFIATSLPYPVAVRFAALLFIAAGWLTNPIWVVFKLYKR